MLRPLLYRGFLARDTHCEKNLILGLYLEEREGKGDLYYFIYGHGRKEYRGTTTQIPYYGVFAIPL